MLVRELLGQVKKTEGLSNHNGNKLPQWSETPLSQQSKICSLLRSPSGPICFHKILPSAVSDFHLPMFRKGCTIPMSSCSLCIQSGPKGHQIQLPRRESYAGRTVKWSKIVCVWGCAQWVVRVGKSAIRKIFSLIFIF